MVFDKIMDPALELTLDHDYGGIQGLSNKFLGAVAKGEVDIKALLELELAARGYDADGKWIGLTAATNPVLAKYRA